MTTHPDSASTSPYTVDALLQAIHESFTGSTSSKYWNHTPEWLLARAAELTAQNSAADAIVGHKWRASPAKDGGDRQHGDACERTQVLPAAPQPPQGEGA